MAFEELYADVTYADTYHSTRGNSDWASLTASQKYGALVYASEYLDNNFDWYSTILDTSQIRDWPRRDYYSSQGRLITGIPTAIKNATCELALAHTKDSLIYNANEGLKSQSFGDASETYSGTSGAKAFSAIKISLSEYGTSGKTKVNIIWRA